MKRIAAAILVLCVLFGAGPVRGEQEPAPSITVVGSGTAAAPPDTAEVTAGVVTQATTAAQALTQNSAAMDRVMKAVTGLGIAERDVRTSGVSVMPQRAEPQPGRRQRRQSRLRGHNRSREGQEHRDSRPACSTRGRPGCECLGDRFSVADPAPLLMEARTRAIADARRKAEVYTAAAGVKLGRIIFIRDASPGIPRPMAARMMASSGVPVAPGEQELEATVSVTYGLE